MEEDGIVISTKVSIGDIALGGEGEGNESGGSPTTTKDGPGFSLSSPSMDANNFANIKLIATETVADPNLYFITETLNPNRSPGILPFSVFFLLSSQMKLIAGLAHKHLIEATARNIAKTAVAFDSSSLG